MKHIYVIPGTGVPKDIRFDLNYQLFLRQVFNRIFDDTTKRHILDPLIIFTGGHTDCWPPYKRSEAAEMAKLFKSFMAGPVTRTYTRQWKIKLEDKSISSLENHLFVKRLVGNKKTNLTWFAELTRVKRHQALGRHVFGQGFKTIGIDYDVSANRYRLGMIDDREKLSVAHDFWALRKPANQRAHHRYFLERFKFLRSFPVTKHVEAVHQWRVQMAVKKLPVEFKRVAQRRGLI